MELARAVNNVTECIYPVIHNASNAENVNKMRGGAFEFSHNLLIATDEIVSLVANLRKPDKSDMTLSQGNNVCIIPAGSSCFESNWADVSIIASEVKHVFGTLLSIWKALHYSPKKAEKLIEAEA